MILSQPLRFVKANLYTLVIFSQLTQIEGGTFVFFDRFQSLCQEKGISVYRACQDIGLNRSAVAKWKAGGKPNGTTAGKLADYFGVSTDYLLGLSQQRTESAPTDEQIKFALFGGDGIITDEMYAEVKQFAAFVKQREAEKKE